jgi:hypothetical protein
MKIGIIGYGEVGHALGQVYKKNKKSFFVKDLEKDEGLDGCYILHFCTPYNDDFLSDTTSYINHYNPEYAVIHSTVPPGTTNEINKLTACNVAHSPIRGIHPELLEGILTFEKYVGSDFDSGPITDHFKSLGIKTRVTSSRTSEIAKLLSTTYYGVCIAWHGEMKKICDNLNVDFEEAVTEWNKDYNESYMKLGKGNVVRPVLYPPNKIGGHCVIPNAKILKGVTDSTAIDLLLEYS